MQISSIYLVFCYISLWRSVQIFAYIYLYTKCNICTRCILWVGGMWWGWYVMWGYWTTYGLVLKVLDNAMQAYRWPQLSSDIKRVDSCQNSRQIWCTCHWRLGGEVIVNILWNRSRKNVSYFMHWKKQNKYVYVGATIIFFLLNRWYSKRTIDNRPLSMVI